MKASQVKRDLRPLRIVVLGPSAFADEYAKKHPAEVAIGLRLIPQSDLDRARVEAEREAVSFYASFGESTDRVDDRSIEDVYNDAFMAHVVARATCNPNDVTQPYFAMAEDVVRVALTAQGIRRLWDEVLLLHKGASPARPRANDAEVKRFGRILQSLTVDDETRMMVAYLLAKHGDADPGEPEAQDDDEDGEGTAVYTARVA